MAKRVYSRFTNFTPSDNPDRQKRHKHNLEHRDSEAMTNPKSNTARSKQHKKFVGPVSFHLMDIDMDESETPSTRSLKKKKKNRRRPHEIDVDADDAPQTRTSSSDPSNTVPMLLKDKADTKHSRVQAKHDRKHSSTIKNGSSPGTSAVRIEMAKLAFEGRPYTATKTPHPFKMIKGGIIESASKQAILWSQNQDQSPLLRLPQHVQSLIYDLVLGNKTIIIKYQTYRIERRRQRVLSCTPVFKYHSIVLDHPTMIPFRDQLLAGVTESSGMTLLNGVCRQLYVETSALPYKNRIAFWSHNIMFNFLFMEKRLNRRQCEAITAIYIREDTPAPCLLKMLPNLSRIHLSASEHAEEGAYRVVRDGREPVLEKAVLARQRLVNKYGIY
ncbi:hypothetical protein P280DRAFT_467113 [Massarina eburnea CBS 473.64]|uniref:DUF7730 domain-containing protein n=1 Tax=Massarina eburnea CBS 473.64 TaxID=1395130 RepID=A0A6A6S553_9PLEO|nr:hypothetical protein P280DRAFT_467113 [Massarina eburnea CBS 473.64]